MENATKALLIAAAVLVVIILIAFGMRILSTSSGTQDKADASMNSAKAQAFNQSFTAYAGKRVNGSSVRNLITAINQSAFTDATNKVTIDDSGDVKTMADVDDTKSYSVTFTYETDTSKTNVGYITGVLIKAN